MAKSMVERYEQVLSQDPASTVFVELARALLEQGEAARAAEVCAQGLTHHATSVVGRVLWGKALIVQGRPAEAMSQFDQAIAIDRDNPHAYNLIAETLLQRGLYRSALPILRKAVALQPEDGRVRLWLEQTQGALAGGPAPVLADLNTVTRSEPPPAQPPQAARAADLALPAPAASAGEQGGTQAPGSGPDAVDVDLTTPAQGTPRYVPAAAQPEGRLPEGQLPEVRRGGARAERPRGAPPVLEAAAPPVLQPVGAAPLLHPVDGAPAQARPEAALPSRDGLLNTSDRLAVSEALEAALPPEAAQEGGHGGLLGALAPLPVPLPAPAAPPASSSNKRGLLEDLPELATPAAPEPLPGAASPATTSPTRAAEIAQAYERELREKLAQSAARPSLLERHGPKLALALVAVVVLGVGAGVFLTRRAAQGGQTLGATLDQAERALGEDTPESLERALSLLALAQDMDEDSTRAWGLRAHAHALRFSEYGQSPEERRLALEALAQPGVREEQPALALVTDLRVADDRARAAARKALLAARLDSAEVYALAGQLALQDDDAKAAVRHFQRALALSPRHVRALVSLGGYYLAHGDLPNARKVYETAREASPQHPAVRVGLAEVRLALGQELPRALADMEALGKALGKGGSALPDGLRERRVLAHARLLSELGRHPEARALLAAQPQGRRSFEVQLALGQVARVAGDLEAAQRAFEAALGLRAGSEEALEGLGRTLVDRDREREALSRLSQAPGRRLALVRGAAWARLGEWKRSRAELARTRVADRYPPEAVVYLALADAAAGSTEQARSVLERTLAAAKGARGPVQVALGRVYLQQGQRERARTQFEAASKDPLDYEGACALGRLLLSQGLPDLALEPLERAVARNGFHGEARDALGRTLLALGRGPEALKQFEAWQLDNPGEARAQRGFALALLHAGRLPEAQAAAARALKLEPKDAETHRLRAVLAFRAGDARGGFAALERSNKLDPHSAETFCEIAHAFGRQGNAAGAQKAFEAARREGPEASCGQVGEHWALLPAGGGRPAARTLQQLSTKAPSAWERAFAQAALARVLLEAGALKEARAAAQEAVRLDPQSGRSHLALGLVALRQRDEAAGTAALRRAAELEPADGPVRLALGDALSREDKDAASAVAEYEAFLQLAGEAAEAARVKKALPVLKRRLVAVGR